MQILIIGNGVAGIEAARRVRAKQPTWEITIISEESDHFFSRTALMYVLSGQMSHRDIEPYERDLYARERFRRIRARAIGLDPIGHRVKLAGGLEPVPYDRLLIASGSRPRPASWPGSDLAGIGHFVTLQDLEWLEAELHGGPGKDRPPRADAHKSATAPGSPYTARPVASAKRGRRPSRVAVIGGGLIGGEVVETVLAARLEPHFLIRQEWFWPMAIDRREAAWVAERMREHGVQMYLEHEVEGFEGDPAGNLKTLRTDHGPIDCDVAVVAIGVLPNTEWLAGSGIDIARDQGIVVSDGLRTSLVDVWAAGDCASVRWYDGSRRPEQLWYTARDQGRIAGAGLLGETATYNRGVWYNSAKLMDLEYTTVGLVPPKLDKERDWFFEERGTVKSTTRVVVAGDRVIGFNFLGRRWDHSVLIRWIEEKRALKDVLGRLNEASFDTELVPPLQIPPADLARGPGDPSKE